MAKFTPFKIGFKYKALKNFKQGETDFAEGMIVKCVNITHSNYDSANIFIFSLPEGGGKTIELWMSDAGENDEYYSFFEQLPLTSKYKITL